ncbi:MAG: hypothetical protein GY724_29035 [Actinomycetia bacterium]|nr:hypothetical protein [Actinomycetes bacterium]
MVLALVLAACAADSEPAVLVTPSNDATDESVESTAEALAGNQVERVDVPGELTTSPDPAHQADAEQQEQQSADDDSEPGLGRPDEIVTRMHDALESQPVAGAEVLDVVGPLDEVSTPEEIQDSRDERDGVGDPAADGPRNEVGGLNQLDETASLACADVERALTSIDEGAVETAVERVASAAARASESGVAGIAAWSDTLDGASSSPGDDIAVLLGFLSSCTEGGYEL